MKSILNIFICFTFSQLLWAQQWSGEFHLGYANNLPSKLTIKQQGFPDLSFTARYSSEPFVSPVYWLWRISYVKNESQKIEFEAVHHKIYLKNYPPEIQIFGISHGLNLLMINHVHILPKLFHVNYGIGTILAHPETEIRNFRLPDKRGIFGMGYYFSGIAVNLSAGKYFRLSNRLYVNTELRFNPSYSVIPIAKGKAYVWNYSYQAIAGIGYYFYKP